MKESNIKKNMGVDYGGQEFTVLQVVKRGKLQAQYRIANEVSQMWVTAGDLSERKTKEVSE